MRSVMKGELFCLFKSGALFILLAVLAAVLACLAKNYGDSFYYQNEYNGYGIVRYEQSELPEIISEYEKILAENERLLAGDLTARERENLKNETDGIKTRLNAYRYIFKHEIAYDDYRDFAGLRNYYGDDALSAFATLCERLSALLPFAFSVFAVWLLLRDDFRGTYKFLYSTQIPRRKIAAGRYAAWLTVSAAGVFLCCAAAACLGFLFGESGGGIVVFANASGAFGFNAFGVFCFELSDILFRTLAIGSMSFGLSLLCRNALLPALPSLSLTVGAFFAYAASEFSPFLSVLLGGFPFAFFVGGTRAAYILYAALIGAALAAACIACGARRFVKRDIK